jgi:hypothetical protein
MAEWSASCVRTVVARSCTDDLGHDGFNVRDCLACPGVRFQKPCFAVCALTLLVAARRSGSLGLHEAATQKRSVGREYLALITGDRARCTPRALLGRGLFLDAPQLN